MNKILTKKNIPNILTMARGVMAVGLVAVFLSNLEYKFIAVYVLFLLAALTDFFDGFLARKWGVVSNFGITFDPLFDKILVYSILLLVLPLNIIPRIIIFLLLARDLITDLMRNLLLAKKIKTPSIKTAKYKTTFQLLMINFIVLFLIFPEIEELKTTALGLSFLAVALSLFSGIIYAKRFFFISKKTT